MLVVLVVEVGVVEVLVVLELVMLVVVVLVVVVLVVKKMGFIMASTEKRLNCTESMHACCVSERHGPWLSEPVPSSQSMFLELQ